MNITQKSYCEHLAANRLPDTLDNLSFYLDVQRQMDGVRELVAEEVAEEWDQSPGYLAAVEEANERADTAREEGFDVAKAYFLRELDATLDSVALSKRSRKSLDDMFLKMSGISFTDIGE